MVQRKFDAKAHPSRRSGQSADKSAHSKVRTEPGAETFSKFVT